MVSWGPLTYLLSATLSSRGKLHQRSADDTTPQASRLAALKALATLDPPWSLICICWDLWLHYSLNPQGFDSMPSDPGQAPGKAWASTEGNTQTAGALVSDWTGWSP